MKSRIIVAITLILLITGCDPHAEAQRQQEWYEENTMSRGVPEGATNVEYLNRDWITFEWRGQCFLARRSYSAHGTAQLTRVDCE